MLEAYKFINPILATLLTAEHRRLEANVVRIHGENKRLWGKLGEGFVHAGEFFVPKGTPNGKRQILPLHRNLRGEVDAHLEDRQIIETDGKEISQLLFKLIEPCFNERDLRNAVPECIIDTLPERIRAHDRCCNPSFFLNHPRDFKLYERVLPRIEFYSAARMLY